MVTALLAAAAIVAPPQDPTRDLLPIGSKAPDFTLKTSTGKSLKFSDVYKKNKATILNFWFVH